MYQYQLKLGGRSMRLKDKVVIITGAGGGIGRASAVRFAREGAKVVIHGRREINTRETFDQVLKAGGNGIYILGDVRKEEDVKRVVDAAADEYGKIDILFNNAGVGYSSGYQFSPLPQVPTADWNSVFEINIRSVYFSCKYTIPYMVEQKGGVILNCCSINGVVGCGAESYSATKGAMLALTKAMAVENGKYNIRVNCVSPAATRTPMINELIEKDRSFRETWGSVAPIKGFIEPEDIAGAALFLVSDEARFITGQNLIVDGGFTIS